jgi:hypothetical protein
VERHSEPITTAYVTANWVHEYHTRHSVEDVSHTFDRFEGAEAVLHTTFGAVPVINLGPRVREC